MTFLSSTEIKVFGRYVDNENWGLVSEFGEYLLKKDPRDGLGVRYAVMSAHAMENDLEAAEDLARRYCDFGGDFSDAESYRTGKQLWKSWDSEQKKTWMDHLDYSLAFPFALVLWRHRRYAEAKRALDNIPEYLSEYLSMDEEELEETKERLETEIGVQIGTVDMLVAYVFVPYQDQEDFRRWILSGFTEVTEEEAPDWIDEEEEGDDLTPIIHLEDLCADDLETIQKLAVVVRKEADLQKGNGRFVRFDDEEKREAMYQLFQEEYELQMSLLQSSFCQAALGRQDAYICKYFNDVDQIEDLKVLAGHLMFIYGELRLEAETKGEEVNEEYFYAAMSCFRGATALQEIVEGREDREEEEIWEEDGDYSPESMGKPFVDYIKKADVDDEYVAAIGESTEAFLREKGFDITTLAGCKAAQKWLESAKPKDAFWTEGEITDPMDQYMGEARIADMLKFVKDRIEKKVKFWTNS